MSQTTTSKTTPQQGAVEEQYAYFEGQFLPMSEAKISIATHALQYGTACFEGIRAYWNAEHEQLYVLHLGEHYQRMFNSWNVLRMQPPESPEEILEITLDLLRRQNFREDLYIRPFTYKASNSMKPTLRGIRDAFAVYAFPMGNYVDISSGLSACVSSWRRANSNAMPIRAKVSGAYVNSSLAANDAAAAGFDEAIMLTEDGAVSEASASNLFIYRNGRLVTPAISDDILEGITRNSLITLLREDLGIPVEERRIDRTELYAADEVFLCGTGVQVSPVTSIDHRPVGKGQPGDLAMRLQQAYLAVCRGENPRYSHWLTPVYAKGADHAF